MSEKKKVLKWVSPVGVALYPHLMKPDTRFGENKFTCRLAFKPSEVKDIVNQVKALAKDAFDDIKGKHLPFKKEEDGTVSLQAKTEFKPAIVDSKGVQVTGKLAIGNGSQLRMSVAFSAYEGMGGGVTAYLNSVQVISLVEFGAGSEFGEYQGDDDAYVADASLTGDVEDEKPETSDGGDDGETFDF
jgi:hypothetical protein